MRAQGCREEAESQDEQNEKECYPEQVGVSEVVIHNCLYLSCVRGGRSS
jgi:hypothetical protein